MSGSAYFDCPSCGARFHETELADHWQHAAAQWELDRTRLEEAREAARNAIVWWDDYDDLPESSRIYFDALRSILSDTTQEARE